MSFLTLVPYGKWHRAALRWSSINSSALRNLTIHKSFRDVFEDNMVEAEARGLRGQGHKILSSRCPRGRGQSSRTPSLKSLEVDLTHSISTEMASRTNRTVSKQWSYLPTYLVFYNYVSLFLLSVAAVLCQSETYSSEETTTNFTASFNPLTDHQYYKHGMNDVFFTAVSTEWARKKLHHFFIAIISLSTLNNFKIIFDTCTVTGWAKKVSQIIFAVTSSTLNRFS